MTGKHRLLGMAALAAAGALVAGAPALAQSYPGTAPAPVPAPATGLRQIHVNTNPPGMRAATSHERMAVRTPYTFHVAQNVQTALMLNGSGFERATVPIPRGAHDLQIDVEMSRPVFEWGVALTSIFGSVLIAGVITFAVNFDDEHDDERFFGAALMGAGSPVIAGILMMILDRLRSARHQVQVLGPGTGQPAY